MSDDVKFEISVDIMSDFFSFYNELAAQAFNLDIEKVEYLKQVKSVRFHSYNKEAETTVMKSDIEFGDEIVRCAYLLKYSILNSYCTSNHFQNVYISDPSLFEQFKEMKTARICCLGGGAGTELFSICKVISEFLKNNSNEEHQYFIKLYFTVIDVYHEWKSWIFPLAKKLKFFYKDVIDVRVRFIQADIIEDWEEDVLKAIQKADILTMVKFLSALHLNEADYKKKKDLKMLENVACEMKLNSWIFFLDFAGGGFYKKMQQKMEKRQYFQQCQAFLHQTYSVNKEKLEDSRSFSSFMYPIMYKNCETKVSSATWRKCIPKLNIKQMPKKVKKNKTYKKPLSASFPLEEQMEEMGLGDNFDVFPGEARPILTESRT